MGSSELTGFIEENWENISLQSCAVKLFQDSQFSDT